MLRSAACRVTADFPTRVTTNGSLVWNSVVRLGGMERRYLIDGRSQTETMFFDLARLSTHSIGRTMARVAANRLFAHGEANHRERYGGQSIWGSMNLRISAGQNCLNGSGN